MKKILTIEELHQAVQTVGFLPLFKNRISGFSVEELTDPGIWFCKNVDGPWEWKGPLVKNKDVLYGKFFDNKCGFISRKWFADFLNYRRDGYDFEGRFNDNLATQKEKDVLQIVEEHPNILSIEIREYAGSLKGVDGVLAKLMMKCYLVNSDFSYKTTKEGKRYGWGVARYITPEDLLGEDFVATAYQRTPQASYDRICNHLMRLYADAKTDDIQNMIG